MFLRITTTTITTTVVITGMDASHYTHDSTKPIFFYLFSVPSLSINHVVDGLFCILCSEVKAQQQAPDDGVTEDRIHNNNNR